MRQHESLALSLAAEASGAQKRLRPGTRPGTVADIYIYAYMSVAILAQAILAQGKGPHNFRLVVD